MRGLPIVAVLFAAACAQTDRGPAPNPPSGPAKYARFRVGGQAMYGIVEGNRLRAISGDLLGDWRPTNRTYAISDVRFLPVTPARQVLAVAGNYRSHLGDRPAPENPEIFFKLPSALIGHGDSIVIPKGTADCHYELELVIVMGKRARNVEPRDALKYVLGVTCGNDVSARDWQKNDVQWWRAKSCDTFAACGPYIATGIDYQKLPMELRLNGEVKQAQSTADQVHTVAQIVSWISRHLTLYPGDLIYTGTPGKTSAMKPGDVAEVDIKGIGVLRNPVTGAR